ncbi:MAG TPA: class I SAM-dependent methyltransferase [Steroidobacteraceae bacterium]|nr:class I SAM-dependent methyltransferase [Steroidobacteraceae bacterium]
MTAGSDEAQDAVAFAATVQRFSGFADHYDRCRPQPPAALAGLLAQFGGGEPPALVVDLGSGTGLSSRYWADKAHQVVGIEPSADMRAEALRRTTATNVRFIAGYAHRTPLAAQCAQIVTCMQSLHWMEPQGTFAEARRLLVPGGVFAAIDYDWPPATISWQAAQAWSRCTERIEELEQVLPRERRAPRWDKAGHLTRMRESGMFRHSRELLLHHRDEGDADRYIGLLRSQGGLMDLLKAGHAESALGLPQFEAAARTLLGSAPQHWHWGARVRLGVV